LKHGKWQATVPFAVATSYSTSVEVTGSGHTQTQSLPVPETSHDPVAGRSEDATDEQRADRIARGRTNSASGHPQRRD